MKNTVKSANILVSELLPLFLVSAPKIQDWPALEIIIARFISSESNH